MTGSARSTGTRDGVAAICVVVWGLCAWLSRWFGIWISLGAAAVLLAVGTWLSFTVPADYQQGDAYRIMFVHVPAASLAMIIYAITANASVGALFMAGMVPGILITLVFMFQCWWIAKKRNYPADGEPVFWSASGGENYPDEDFVQADAPE